MNLASIDWIILVGYVAAMLGIGVLLWAFVHLVPTIEQPLKTRLVDRLEAFLDLTLAEAVSGPAPEWLDD